MANVIKTGIFFRTLEWDRQAIDTEKRTVPLSFSSETPVLRSFGWEILDHSPGAVDMSRARLPLLMDHNKSNQIGKVDIAIAGKRGIGVAKFSKSSAAIMEDVTEDIRGDTSVGYSIIEMSQEGEKDGYPVFRATKWRPLEISLVSVPADATVGVGRSQSVDDPQFETRVADPKTTMANPTDLPIVPLPGHQQPPPAPTPSLQVRENDIPEHLMSEDVRQIRATVKHYKGQIEGIEDLARYAEFAQWSMTEFRQKILAQLEAEQAKKQALKPTPLDVKPEELKRYSLTRAICAHLQGGGGLSGIEREMSQEISKKYRSQPEGFWVPSEVLVANNMQRSFVAGTGTLGGFLVQTTNLGQDFIEVLRNMAQVMRLGARTLQLDTPVTIPRQAAQGTTNWVGETVASTLSVGNFDQITLTPRGISANQQYAKQLLVTNNPSIDALVRDDILKIIALAIDLAALHGSGSGGQPTGIIGTTGIGSVALATNGQILANSGTTVYPATVSLETLISSANADRGALAYLMRSAHRGALRVTNRFSSTDSPVWTNGGPFPAGIGAGLSDGASDGIVNGYRAAVTNQIATNLTTGTATTLCSALFFGNWNELLIGQFNGGATDLIVDPYTAGANAVVRLYARHWIDIGVRHGASFAVLGGIL